MIARIIIGLVVLVSASPFATTTRAQEPDEEPEKPQPHKAPPPLEPLFPGQVHDAAGCRKAGGVWFNHEADEGCAIRGKQEGVWLRFANDGTLAWAAVWKNSVLDGRSIRFHPNGQIKEDGTFVAGKRQGPFRGYWDTGALRFEENLVDDKRQGPWHVYLASGQPEIESAYKDDQLQGAYTEWHRNCFKSKEGQYVGGKEDGVWREWTDKGVLLSEGTFKDGQRIGRWKFYHEETRALVEEGEYVAGKRQGTWTESFATGQRFREVEWKDDQRVGEGPAACAKIEGASWVVDFAAREEGCQRGMPPWATRLLTWRGYFEDGAKKWERTYDEGVVHGMERDWHPDGKLLHEGMWQKGVPTGHHAWLATDGKTAFGVSDINDGSGTWRAFFHTGKPKEAGRYSSGLKSGTWTTWFDNGNKSAEESYVAGLKNGAMKWWFESGQLKVSGDFKDDNRSGTWTAWWTNGHIAWEGPYGKDGERTGTWREFYPDGTPKNVGEMLNDEEVGVWTEFHDNGEKSGEGPMVRGKRHGVWKFWWKTGELWRETQYDNGVEVGSGDAECKAAGGEWVNLAEPRLTGCQLCRWQAKAEEGDEEMTPVPEPKAVSPVATPHDKQPEHDGTAEPQPATPDPKDAAKKQEDPAGKVVKSAERDWIFWHPNGKREKQGRFKDGKPDGQWTFWYEDGTKMLEGTLDEGVENGLWTGWHPNRQKKFEGSFDKGVETGAWKTFGPDGKVRAEGRYEAGKKVGVWAYYHSNGQKRDEGTFEADEESGPWVSYHANGKKRGEGSYKAGKRDGTWTWYREDGSVWRTANYAEGKEVQASQ
ncbi:MAG: toxin-antitoxin system YwqK family antitoxin [Deltaproteobacteria bacterium]|nr:toxin-antitoxin system YwqK family antitoxin [Deltaproteobacteria bacterium]